MSVTVGQVMRSIHNYFESGYRATQYRVQSGQLTPSEVFAPGMYIAITGSVFHDGVWQIGPDGYLVDYPETGMDETFYGRVYFLRPPHDFLETCKHIAEFAQNTPVSAVQSESFGEYSVTEKTGKNGGVLTWQEAFADDLREHYRMFSEVF